MVGETALTVTPQINLIDYSESIMKNPTPSLHPLMAISAGIITALALSVSVYQSAGFLSRLSTTPNQRIFLFIAAFALIIGSQLIARLIGSAIANKAPMLMLVLAIVCVMGTEGFSVSTSMVSFTNVIDSKTQAENQNSDEYRMRMNIVNTLQSEINEQQNVAKAMPASWITRKQQQSDKVVALMSQLQAAQRATTLVDGSVTSKTFKGVRDATGGYLTPERISLAAALLLSIVPLTIAMLVGYLGTKRGKAGKKPRAQ